MRTRKKDDDGGIAFFDIQSKLESDTPDDKNMMAVTAMLNNNMVLNASPLNALNVLVDFISTHTLPGRSENERNEMMSFNLLMSLKSIGPNGMKATCNVLNKVKLMKNGRLRYSGCVTHKNQYFSIEAVKGLVLFYIFSAMGELFPDFLHQKTFL